MRWCLWFPRGKGSNFLGLGAVGVEECPPFKSGATFKVGDAAPLRVTASRPVPPAEGVILPREVAARGLEGFPLSLPPKTFQVWGAEGQLWTQRMKRGVMPRSAAVPP